MGREQAHRGTGSRERILRVAEGLFVRRGYRRTSLKDILRAARVSRSNFYYHFPSKRRLLHCVLNAWLKVGQEIFFPVLTDKSLDPMTRIRTLFALEEKWIAGAGHGVGCPLLNLMLEMQRSGGMRFRELERYLASFAKALEDLCREAVGGGQFRKGLQVRPAVGLVLVTLYGANVLSQLEGSPRPLRACARQLPKFLSGR